MKLYIDKKLKYLLDILINDLEQDDDALIIIAGQEGAGKSYLETQIGKYLSFKLNKPFSIDNLHFDGQAYINFSLNSPPKTIVCLDESRRALNKMRAASTENQDFMNFLSECRSENQIHIILLPGYSDLDRYVAIHRPKIIIYVIKERDKKTGKLKRGYYNIYKTKDKNLLEIAWKSKYKLPPKSMLYAQNCKFLPLFAIDKKLYDEKKKEAKKERYLKEDDNNVKVQEMDIKPIKIDRDKTLNETSLKVLSYLKKGYKRGVIAKKMGLSAQYVGEVRQKLKNKGFIE